MTYQLPTDADGVKYHGREYDDKGGIIAVGVDEHGNDKPILINTDGSLNMQSVVQELHDIKQRQQEILERLDDPIDTRLTGSNVEEERISISDLDVDEREEYRITPPENAVYKILNVSFDLRPNDKLRFRMFVGSASRDRRVFEISTTKNISCFTNYLDVDFDDVIIGARNELEG